MIKARIPAPNKEEANLKDYPTFCKTFSWEGFRSQLGLDFGPGNLYFHLVSKALQGDLRDKRALLFHLQGTQKGYSFAQIDREASRWAALFEECGLKQGERVFFLLPTSPALYMGILGAIRKGLVITPLYHSLTIAELEIRLLNGQPSCVVTDFEGGEALSGISFGPLKAIIYVDPPKRGLAEKELLYEELGPNWAIGPVEVSEDSPLYLIYTSGSTGPPKGILHSHSDKIAYYSSGLYALDLKEGDILWMDGPPAWVAGIVYGLFTPLLLGITSVIQTGEFEPALWYQTLESSRVTVWYTTPMILRRLRDSGRDLPKRYDLSSLRLILTVGEALPPDIFYWTKEAIGLYPHDTWWMTETGSICISNFPSLDLKPGSMGRVMPGIDALVVDEKGEVLPPMSLGELALRTPWPSMLTGIFRDEERFKEYLRFEGLFLTGDMVVQDEEGYFYHHGRVDDIIKIGDRMVGPFDVENVLLSHPAIGEAAVISKSTPQKGTFMKAFVALKQGFSPSLRLGEELKAYARANLNLNLPLREVEFMERLPRTRAGKLLRRVLRAKELGIPISY